MSDPSQQIRFEMNGFQKYTRYEVSLSCFTNGGESVRSTSRYATTSADRMRSFIQHSYFNSKLKIIINGKLNKFILLFETKSYYFNIFTSLLASWIFTETF